MKYYDPEKAARVWQRVRGSGTAPTPTPSDPLPETLPAMIAGEWADAAVYLRLSHRLSGRDAALLRQLFEQEQGHAACLKGILTLLTGRPSVSHTAMPQNLPTEVLLRQCYGREMESLKQYEQLSAHREFGAVFAKLAQQEREHCHTLLEILGRLKT